MTIQVLNTVQHNCELNQTKLLTISAMSVRKLQLADYLLPGNRIDFPKVEGSTSWLYDCPQFLSPLIEADKSFDRIPLYYQDIEMYIDPTAKPLFIYAPSISFDNSPKNIITLDPDNDEHFVLTNNPLLRANLTLFEQKSLSICNKPNTPTAQESSVSANAQLTNFWSHDPFHEAFWCHTEVFVQKLSHMIFELGLKNI